MKYDLKAMIQRSAKVRRKAIVIRDTPMPAVLASDLFASAYRPVLALIDRYAALAAAEYERSLSALITDSGDDLTNIFERMGQELASLVLLLRPSLRDWTIKLERQSRRRWSAAVLAATNVSLDTLLGPEDVAVPLETALNWNVSLVRDVSDQARQRIASAVFAGLTNRTPAREVAKQIRDATGMARSRSLLIASDQTSKLSATLADERARQAGISEVIWRSSKKLHARPHHAARDGKLFDLDTHKAIDGSETVPAGDWVAQPPWCGCRAQASIRFE